ncbi:MAG: SpoIIE family protein phosphatase [Leptonema sp. (in: bacteria)]
MFSQSDFIFIKNWEFCYREKDLITESCEWKEWSLYRAGKERNSKNIIWLKTKLPEFNFPDPVLFFDSIDLNFDLFLEDKLMYQYGTFDLDGNVIFQGWPVHLLSISDNWKNKEIYLKVYSLEEYKDLGIWKLQFITNKANLFSLYLPQFFIYSTVCLIFYFSFILSLLFYFISSKKKSILFFSLVSLCLGNYLFFSPENKFLYIIASYPFLYFFLETFSSYFLIIFFSSYIQYIFKNLNRISIALLEIIKFTTTVCILISFIMILFFRNKVFSFHYVFNLFILLSIIVLLFILFRQISELDVNAIYILIGVLSLLILGLFEVTNFFGNFLPINFFYPGSLIFLFANLFVLVKKYGKTFQELEKKEIDLQLKQEQIQNLHSIKDNFIIQLSKKITEPIEEITLLTKQIPYSSSERDLLVRILYNFKKEIDRIKNLLSLEYKEFTYKEEFINFSKFLNLGSVVFPEIENKEIQIKVKPSSEEWIIKFDSKILVEIFNELFFYSSNPIVLISEENFREYRLEIQISSKNTLLYPEISNFFEPYLKLDFLDTTGLYLIKKYCELFESEFNYIIDSKKIEFFLKIPIRSKEERNFTKAESSNFYRTVSKRKIFTLKNEFDLNKSFNILFIHDNPYLLRKVFSLLTKENNIFCTNDLEIAFQQLNYNYHLLILPPILYGNSLNDFLKKIREKYDLLNLSILLISPYLNINFDYYNTYVQDIIFIQDNSFNIFEFTSKIKNTLLSKEYFKKYLEYLRYQTDIQTLSKLQHHFYKKQIQGNQFFRFSIKYLPAEEISGDIAEVYQIQEEQFLFFIGDVTGHGLYSAFFSIFLKMIVFILIDKNKNTDLKNLLNQMNEIILEFFDQQLITCFLVLLKPKIKEIECIRAGHLPAMYYDSKKNEYSVIQPKGKILGVIKDPEFETIQFPYSSGDRLFLLTDGMTENQNINEQDKIFSLIKQKNIESTSIEEVSRVVFRETINRRTNFNEPYIIEDDITTLFVEFL